MRARKAIATVIGALLFGWAQAAPEFVNGVLIPGDTLDATQQGGANGDGQQNAQQPHEGAESNANANANSNDNVTDAEFEEVK